MIAAYTSDRVMRKKFDRLICHRSPSEYLKYDAFILVMKFNDAALLSRQPLRRCVLLLLC
jgi:hypothetical protein